MAQEPLRYDRMVEAALRGVVREALSEVSDRGLPDNHHFYITFRTTHAGVGLADHLRARYPAEMTIVLQFQFYDLTVEEDGFAVTLSFNNNHERLEIPYAAITTFADPSVNFALQFQPLAHAAGDDDEEEEEAPKPARPVLKAVKPGDELVPQAAGRQPKPAPAPARSEKADTTAAEDAADKVDEAHPPAEEPRGQVVALDAFRKK